jgi:hypothetical protein
MLLHARLGGVLLDDEQVLCIPSQRSHLGMEVRALEVGHGLKVLLPYGVLLIPNREKRDRQCCCSGKAVLAQGGDGDVWHHLNAGVGLTTDDGPRPLLHRIEGYHHANLAPIQVVDRGQSTTVDRSVSIVAKTDECIV